MSFRSALLFVDEEVIKPRLASIQNLLFEKEGQVLGAESMEYHIGILKPIPTCINSLFVYHVQLQHKVAERKSNMQN